jgi:hypothetical protein
MTTKITDANIDSDNQDKNAFNISLLGFKMAVNEGLTVFNLVDGVVDEFNDESGTDEAEGSNDVYCATSDFYQNVTVSPACISAGFSTTAITEPDTSTAGTNPALGSGTFGNFTVPCGMTSVNIYTFGAGGGGATADGGPNNGQVQSKGGGGGFASGTLAVTGGQVMRVVVGEGGTHSSGISPYSGIACRPVGGGGSAEPGGPGSPQQNSSSGGGLSGTFTSCVPATAGPQNKVSGTAPQAFVIGGAGGGGGIPSGHAGYGGGLIGDTASSLEQTNQDNGDGGAGSQVAGGQGGTGPGGPSTGGTGGLFYAGSSGNDCNAGGGGSGYYGGGGGGLGQPVDKRRGGGGSSYYGHPQITCGATTRASGCEAGGTADPNYQACTSEGGNFGNSAPVAGEDGYVLLTGSYCAQTPGASTTIVSTAFTSSSVATNARIVVFEENVDTPTLNTDIIASISRDAGVTFTNATLSDSGYVTGSSGQRILTGQADISGQPSGQSMRWKLALANNTVKIHGVSLQWS